MSDPIISTPDIAPTDPMPVATCPPAPLGWLAWVRKRVVLFPLLALGCLGGGIGLSRLASHADSVREPERLTTTPLARNDGGDRASIAVPFNVPAFDLADQAGHRVSVASLKGHPWVGAFIYSSCSSTCATVSERMGQLQQVAQTKYPTRLVTFCADSFPIDGNLLRSFARTLKADADHWSVLAGEPSEVNQLAVAMHALPKVSAEEWNRPIPHPWIFLIDSDGQVRAIFDALDKGVVTQVAHDLGALDSAIPPNKVSTR